MDWIADSLPLFMLPVLAAVLFSGYPVAFLLAGVGLLFAGLAVLFDLMPVVALYNLPLRVSASISNSLIYPAVPMLLFMGLALEKSGAAREMLLCLRLLLGRIPAGLAIAVTLLGILLAPAAGLIGASVATLALVALPTMLEQRYKPSFAAGSFAAGSVAAAGTLLFLATIVPGLTLAGLFVVYYALRGAFDPELAPPARDTEKMKPGRLVLYVGRSLALPVLLVAGVLGSIIAGWATPTQSGAVGAAGGIMLMVLNRSFTLRRLNEVVIGTTLTTSMVFLIVIAATVFSYPFRYLSGDELVVGLLLATGASDWGVLAFILAIIFVLGFFIDWIEITVITLPIFYPLLVGMDFSVYAGSPQMALVLIAVLIALVLQTSFLTPPFGFALFFVKGAAPPGVTLADVYRGIVPLVGIQLLMLVLVAAFPVLATGLPSLAFE